mmetsp:Transcript_9610/g.29132  ORF Transcript_9610/g.29132 Transcript_9610/m.29132 type:complete len:209 (-) Transcript_9610:46-672(-)
MGRASCGPVAAAQWLAAAAAAVCCSEEVHGAKEGISARSGTPQQPSRGDDHEWRCQQRQRSDAQQHLVHRRGQDLQVRAGGQEHKGELSNVPHGEPNRQAGTPAVPKPRHRRCHERSLGGHDHGSADRQHTHMLPEEDWRDDERGAAQEERNKHVEAALDVVAQRVLQQLRLAEPAVAACALDVNIGGLQHGTVMRRRRRRLNRGAGR